VAGNVLTDDAKERLNVMLRTASGFDIAEADLRIRGPGDFLGTRQAGMPDFRFAHPVKDRILMLKARDAAESLFPEGGEMPEILKKDVKKFWSEGYVLSASG
jgi:ATP-dependent DNA helicase RecG